MTEPKKRGPKPKVTDAKIAEFIGKYVAKNGYSPNVREIADAAGLVSTSAIMYRLRNMEKKGVLTHNQHVARSWRVVGTQGAFAPATKVRRVPIGKAVDAATPVAV